MGLHALNIFVPVQLNPDEDPAPIGALFVSIPYGDGGDETNRLRARSAIAARVECLQHLPTDMREQMIATALKSVEAPTIAADHLATCEGCAGEDDIAVEWLPLAVLSRLDVPGL